MFERGSRSENAGDSQTESRRETDSALGTSRIKANTYGGDCAVIGRSIEINGDLRGGEDLRIEGDVSGTVELRNNSLTIGKEGKVKADLYAKAIAVDGEIKGDLYATERVSVHVNARVQGNIIAPRVSIEEGAHFKGSIEMDPSAVEKALGKTVTNGTVKAPQGNQPAKPAGAPQDKAASAKSGKEATTNLNPPTGTA